MKILVINIGIWLVDANPVSEQFVMTAEIPGLGIPHGERLMITQSIVYYVGTVSAYSDVKVS